MRVSYRLISLLVLGLVSLPLVAQQMQNVPAAQPATTPAPGLRVGVLDVQEAIERTQEGQKATEDLQAQFGPRNSELQKLAQEIQEIENQLRRQERTLSDDARLQLARQVEQKRRQATRLQEDIQADFQIAQNDHIGKIWGKMQRVIDQYAREKGFAVIINSSTNPSPVIYAAPAVEITQDVIQLYDQLHPVAAAPAASSGPAKPAPRPAQPSAQQQPPPQPPR
ncbi:MAG: OmpH family outer membrane protein [Acidobacteria bacterium]|nr:OmpH family outer membrane protein [Acidobacteriota bacterium]